MADPEARERKRLKDRERRLRILESPEMTVRRRDIEAKFRKSEKYAKRAAFYSEKNKRATIEARDNAISEKAGAFTPITISHCACCSARYARPSNTGKRLTATYCPVHRKPNAWTGLRHTPKQKECGICGVLFVGLARAKRCDECKAAVSKEAKRITGTKFRTRARHYGCHYEPVNRLAVYKRDKYRCYVCGCRVRESKTRAKDMATLDHIIPLSRGGPHTYDNVKTCCSACNSSKSDAMPTHAQLNVFTSPMPSP